MTDRDTTATPYRLSPDGACYFRYPAGDAPVVVVEDYAELRAKGLADAGAGRRIWVTEPGIDGVFEWLSDDPYGDGEDGGAVFAASDGWWSRVYHYKRGVPVELSWYQFNTGDDATSVFRQWMERRPGGIAFRMPDFVGHVTVNTVAAPIKEFALFGGATELWQHPAPDDPYDVFVLNTIRYLATDSALVCRGRYGDFGMSPGNGYDPGAFFRITGAGLVCSFYARFFYTTGRAIDIGGVADDVTIGTHATNSGIRVSAGSNTSLHFDDAYLADPDGNGLKSYTSGLYEKWHGYWVINTQKLTGKITTQYGGTQWFLSGCKSIGNSAQDPFIIETNDQGFDPDGAPNGDAEGTQWNCGKIDGLDSSVVALGQRFFRHVTNGHNRNRHWFVQHEASNETDIGVYATNYISAEFVESGGGIAPVRIGEFNSNPNECLGHEISGNCSWMSVSASESHWDGMELAGNVEFITHHQYVPMDNVMDGCTHGGDILLRDGTLTCNSPTFTGSARKVVSIRNLDSNVVLRINSLTAPAGSTIDKDDVGNPDPEFYLDGVLTSLPYTVV